VASYGGQANPLPAFDNIHIFYTVLLFSAFLSIYICLSHFFGRKERHWDVKIDIFVVCLISALIIFSMPTLTIFQLCFGSTVGKSKAEAALGDSRTTLVLQYRKLDRLIDFNRSKWNEEKNISILEKVREVETKLAAFLKQTGPFSDDHMVIWPQTETLLEQVNKLIDEIKAE